jgi:uncharacterized protein
MRGANHSSSGPNVVPALIFAFSDLPFEGLHFKVEEAFKNIYRPDIPPPESELLQTFVKPLSISGSLTPVGSKVDVRGQVETLIQMPCMRCNLSTEQPLKTQWSAILMPSQQFSPYDKPGGKVIHGRTKDKEGRRSRHHSASKAEVLTDAEGEHEDLSFGAFDGQTIDLREMIREHLLLDLPMTALCSDTCPGLCLQCGEPAREQCQCVGGPKILNQPEPDQGGEELAPPLGALAQALQKKGIAAPKS